MKFKSLLGSALIICVSNAASAAHVYLGPSLFFRQMAASNSGANSLQPRLSLGYGGFNGDYYFAGEIYGTPFTTTLSSSEHNNAPNAKTTRAFGVSFIPGMRLNDDLLAYLRIGVNTTKFSGVNTNKAGAQFGVGFQTAVTSRLDFRIEYIFTAYDSMYHMGSPKSNEIGMGMIYKFGI